MKRSLIALVISAVLLGLGWIIPHSLFKVDVETSTPTVASIKDTAATPTETPTPSQEGIRVNYQNISFVIPAGLASGAEAQTAAAVEGPLEYSPAFIQFTLKDYPVQAPNSYYQPEIRIYPAAEYARVSTWAAESLKRLKNVLANPSAPLENASLPNVPFMGSAAQLYAAQAKIIPFASVNGVRMISAYAQYPAAITQHDSFYHYEGLTQDGQYYVVVEMPVVLPVYSDASNPGENGITYPTNYQGWEDVQPYYQAVTGLLDASSPEGFNPMLTQLDLLVQSINVTIK